MEKKSGQSAASWVVVLMAASSLFSMIGVLKIDQIVHHDLYRYGLHFNYAWAMPYWNIVGFVFLMGWLNIIAAITVHLYTLAFRRKEVEQLVTEVQKEIMETKTTPTEKVEEQKEQEPKPVEAAEEQPREVSVCVTGSGAQENKEEKQTVAECAQTHEETESKQSEEVEDQKEEESMRPTESKTEQEEHRETSPELPEENKETPLLTGL